ncbi:GNAT family N-acetyltransferase [Mucilaginibacter sp.]|uniref:GNAT family N-acetyltransferase n=1 Tax=Mucilaginibacter sp. TaxID=1882438 RepID=UPI00284AA4E6|nr:GNAT family N-acetyltransferase [Mucilaginibacter sp.]MDR3695306.1 GNAT family N-acetyltransferase [Mucilaginibacter sp.]
MLIQIQNTTHSDIPAIFSLYDEAIIYQKQVGNNYWLGFGVPLIEKEISENRHFKILLNGKIGGTFIITLDDKLIWKLAQDDPALYIHRIATAQASRGNDLVKHIIEWAKTYAKQHQLSFIRMDTGSGNQRLINYYERCGFTIIDTNTTVAYTPELPAHYENGVFTLLEMVV